LSGSLRFNEDCDGSRSDDIVRETSVAVLRHPLFDADVFFLPSEYVENDFVDHLETGFRFIRVEESKLSVGSCNRGQGRVAFVNFDHCWLVDSR